MPTIPSPYPESASPVFRAVLMTLLLLGLALAPAWGKATGEAQPLILLNWNDYFDPQVLQDFTATTGIPVKEVHFETDEMREELLSQTGGQAYDLVLIDSERAFNTMQAGRLAPLPRERMPHLAHIEPRWREASGAVKDHVVPLFWGTLGIAYRQDLIPEKLSRWEQLFHPPQAWRGRIALIKDSGDLVGMALKSLGRSLNPREFQDLEGVEELLMAQKPFVRSYGYPSLEEDSELLTGATWIAMLYNGDALALAERDPRVVFVIPEEGTMLWLDTLAVMANSPRKEQAFAFLDFIHRPEIAARMALFSHFATVNRMALDLLPQEHRDNPIIHPTAEVLARSEFSQTLPPRVMKRIKSIFNRVTP